MPNLQQMQAAIHRKDVCTGAAPCVGIPLLLTQPPEHGAMPSEGIQGNEWATYVPLDTYNKDERGIAYGTRVLRRRRPRTSRQASRPAEEGGKAAYRAKGAR
jgi:hypothetical protein